MSIRSKILPTISAISFCALTHCSPPPVDSTPRTIPSIPENSIESQTIDNSPASDTEGWQKISSRRSSSNGRGRKTSQPSIIQDFIPAGKFGRHQVRRMKPRYITVHSTANFSRGATAKMHSLALRRGALTATHNSLGYLTWHFTVDDHSTYQHLPLNEQGQHADYEGPGNLYSIGIEMAENSDGNKQKTVLRTTELVAWLMHKHNIPLSRVVPHYHWRRIRYLDGLDVGHKACPGFLMDNGKPGNKWRGFLKKVDQAYRGR